MAEPQKAAPKTSGKAPAKTNIHLLMIAPEYGSGYCPIIEDSLYRYDRKHRTFSTSIYAPDEEVFLALLSNKTKFNCIVFNLKTNCATAVQTILTTYATEIGETPVLVLTDSTTTLFRAWYDVPRGLNLVNTDSLKQPYEIPDLLNSAIQVARRTRS